MLAMSGEIDNFTKVNLDVTTLIALVSELTHGGCWYKFPEPLISELAEQERLQPLLPELNAFLQGRRMQWWIAILSKPTDSSDLCDLLLNRSKLNLNRYLNPTHES